MTIKTIVWIAVYVALIIPMQIVCNMYAKVASNLASKATNKIIK